MGQGAVLRRGGAVVGELVELALDGVPREDVAFGDRNAGPLGLHVPAGPLEEQHEDQAPDVEGLTQLHHHAGDLLVGDRVDAPQMEPGVVRAVHRLLGEDQPRRRDGRDDRLQEQVEHLARQRQPHLGQRSAHRHPHEQRGRHDQHVQREVQRRGLHRRVHRRRPVHEHERGVEQHGRGHGPAQPPHDVSGEPTVADDQARQPRRRRQQEQRRHDHGEQQVLRHVHRVQVALADVVHGPVGGEPQHDEPAHEPELLATGHDRRTVAHDLRSDDPGCVHRQADDPRDQQPHLGVGVEPPRIDGGDHVIGPAWSCPAVEGVERQQARSCTRSRPARCPVTKNHGRRASRTAGA